MPPTPMIATFFARMDAKDASTAVLASFASILAKKVAIIGVGGISTVDDAKAKIDAGADLVQIYTSFIYQGPALVKAIAKSL